jgi:multiple sugar transport system substrate-binding protein
VLPLDVPSRGPDLAALACHTVGRSHQSYAYAGRQWALAIDAATQVAALRPDLLAQPPRTWDAVMELAGAGRVLWPLKPVDALMSFFTLCANGGSPCATTAALQSDPAAGIAALERMRGIARRLPVRCFSMNPPETLDALSRDDGFVYCPLLYGYTNYARPGFRGHRIRFADIPEGADGTPRGSTLGGTGIAVSASCRHPRIAMEYAFWIAGADCQRGLYFSAGGQPAHSAAWDDPAANERADGFFSRTRRTIELSWTRPRFAQYIDFQDKAGAVVNRFLQSQDPAGRALGELESLYPHAAHSD